MKYCDVVATCKACRTVCPTFSTVSKERDKLRFGIVHHVGIKNFSKSKGAGDDNAGRSEQRRH
jgi:epoxyqueuosine reductase QueG